MDPKRIDDVLAAVLSDLKSITDMANSTLEDVRAIRSLIEKKPPTHPMMNDAKLDINLDSPRGNRYPTSSEATAFSVRLESVYRKSGNGGYDWSTTNKAARKFLSQHSEADRERLCRFVEHHSSLAGRLSVFPGMFDELWAFMIDKGG